MRHRRRMITVLATALAAGCTQGAADVSSNRIAELCNATTNIGENLCRCVGNKAETGLSERSREFLVATLEQGEESRLAELRGQLTLEELMKAGMFMTTAPAQCAKESATSLPQDPS